MLNLITFTLISLILVTGVFAVGNSIFNFDSDENIVNNSNK